jgi:hypothetical protein
MMWIWAKIHQISLCCGKATPPNLPLAGGGVAQVMAQAEFATFILKTKKGPSSWEGTRP